MKPDPPVRGPDASDTAIDDLIRSLEAPEPPLFPPPLPRPGRSGRPWLFAGLALAAVAAGVLLVVQPADDGPALVPRGAAGGATPVVDLRLVVDGPAGTRRLAQGDTLRVGERIFFRVGADPPSVVRIRVESATSAVAVGETLAGDPPADLRSDAGLVAWEAEAEGAYTVVAATGDGSCAPPSCVSLTVRVLP